MRQSLRRRLILALCGSMVTAWLATALFTYLDTRNLIDEVVDAHLRQSGTMLLGLAGQLPREAGVIPGGKLFETDSGQPISYRIWTGPPPAGWQTGYSNITRGTESWRVFGVNGAHGASVEVAVRQEVRDSFAARVASHILHPLWIAVPLLSAIIWGTVTWGLLPLERLAANVRRRSPAYLEPIPAEAGPREVVPLLDSLNALFARIAAARERDRRFAGDAAHELRTPLAAITTHAQLAQRAADLPACKAAVDNVLTGAARGVRVVEQLLALARVEHAAAAADFTPVDLAAVARDVLAGLGPLSAARDIELGLAGQEERQAMVRGNADLIAALVRNLVENALRYTPQGGRVSVEILHELGNAVLRVVDNGPGIAPDMRSRVLDRFFRVTGSGAQGSGLGLSIVAAIAELHGAQVELKDGEDGVGLCVEVTFPAAQS